MNRCMYVTHVDAPFDIYFCEKPTDLKFEGTDICVECLKREQVVAQAKIAEAETKLNEVKQREQVIAVEIAKAQK